MKTFLLLMFLSVGAFADTVILKLPDGAEQSWHNVEIVKAGSKDGVSFIYDEKLMNVQGTVIVEYAEVPSRTRRQGGNSTVMVIVIFVLLGAAIGGYYYIKAKRDEEDMLDEEDTA